MTSLPATGIATFDTNTALTQPPILVAPQVWEWYGELLFTTCCHEAGHAIAAHRLGNTNITIGITASLSEDPVGGHRGASVNGSTQSLHDLDDHFGAVVVTFAGPLAEPGPSTRPGQYPTKPAGSHPTGTDLDKINAYSRHHGHAEARRAKQTARTLLRQEHQAIAHIAARLFGRGPWVGQRQLDVSVLFG